MFIPLFGVITLGLVCVATLLGLAYQFKVIVRERVRREMLETQILEERKVLESAESKFEKTFQALAAEALNKNVDTFLNLATERLDRKTVEARSVFDEKVQNFHQLIDPLKQTLKKVEDDLTRGERARLEQFGNISAQLLAVTQSSENLRKEASALSSALRRPEVRGSWGEIQLRRVVELAGMSSYCDFEEQVVTRKDDRLQKPDLIIHLPNKRKVIVDAKAVLDSFLTAVEAATPELKSAALDQHAKNLRSRVSDLSRKSYWEQFNDSPDFAVLFIPNESLLAAAVDVDRKLIEDALGDRIVIATPTTLVALLKAIAFGWQQQQVTENADKVIAAAKEFYERVLPWMKHFEDLGGRLEGAVKSFNAAASSLETRVLPSARRLDGLGVAISQELKPQPEIVEVARKLKPIIEPESLLRD